MAMAGQGGWFHNEWVDKCRGSGSDSAWEGSLPLALGVQGFVHPDSSPDSLSQSNLICDPQCKIHSLHSSLTSSVHKLLFRPTPFPFPFFFFQLFIEISSKHCVKTADLMREKSSHKRSPCHYFWETSLHHFVYSLDQVNWGGEKVPVWSHTRISTTTFLISFAGSVFAGWRCSSMLLWQPVMLLILNRRRWHHAVEKHLLL